MTRRLAACAFALLLLACGDASPEARMDGGSAPQEPPPASEPGTGGTQPPPRDLPTDSLIVPDERIGPVAAGVSQAQLSERLGAERVVASHFYIGEGICGPGSRIFPDTPDEIEVLWTDSTRSEPALLKVSAPGSRWATAGGVQVGTTLAELEAMAGAPLHFTGFDWDYGGRTSFPNATDAGEPSIGIQLDMDEATREKAAADPRLGDILGDRSVRSDDPLVRSLTIVVAGIWVSLRGDEVQYDCPPI